MQIYFNKKEDFVMSRTEYLFRRLESMLKDYEGSCINKSFKEKEDIWYDIFNDPYEDLMQELERL